MRLLVACEESGIVRRAFAAIGWDAWSCDLQPAADSSAKHIQGDVLTVLNEGWDMAIMHPPCTRLANSGVRWLSNPPVGRTVQQMRVELEEGCAFYRALRDAPIPLKAIENPVMHRHAKALIGPMERHIVQPHWFGSPFFKATGFELHGLPPLRRTHYMTLPKKGTPEHRAWSACHMASPGPDRPKLRSRTDPCVAKAMASQWGNTELSSQP